jgi:hypothetical protein
MCLCWWLAACSVVATQNRLKRACICMHGQTKKVGRSGLQAKQSTAKGADASPGWDGHLLYSFFFPKRWTARARDRALASGRTPAVHHRPDRSHVLDEETVGFVFFCTHLSPLPHFYSARRLQGEGKSPGSPASAPDENRTAAARGAEARTGISITTPKGDTSS